MSTAKRPRQPGPKSAPPTSEADGGLAEDHSERNAFERLYSRWLAARAAMANPDHASQGVDEDEDMYRLLREHAQATFNFLLAPAPIAWMIWWKFEALELLMEEESRDGERADRLHMYALLAIKVDLERLGVLDYMTDAASSLKEARS